jgi:hypothetical protein
MLEVTNGVHSAAVRILWSRITNCKSDGLQPYFSWADKIERADSPYGKISLCRHMGMALIRSIDASLRISYIRSTLS